MTISAINLAAEATKIPQCSSLSGSPQRLGPFRRHADKISEATRALVRATEAISAYVLFAGGRLNGLVSVAQYINSSIWINRRCNCPTRARPPIRGTLPRARHLCRGRGDPAVVLRVSRANDPRADRARSARPQ